VRPSLPADPRRRQSALALLLFLAAGAFRLPRLHTPAEEYFDEVYHAKSALQYLRGEVPVDWVHPPTSKLLIAAAIAVLGYDAFAWRLAPALAGMLLAPAFFLLARRALASERAALFASALLLADGVYLVQSRIAMTNIFAVLFQVAGAWLLLRAVAAERLGLRDMLAFGAALGLALSTRWTSLFATAFLGCVFLAVRGRRALRPRELALAALGFLAVPAALYVASYLPLMHIRFPEAGPGDWDFVLRKLVEEQKGVWNYHAKLQAEHPYFSPWYTWPLLIRPTLYFFQLEGATGPVRGILALGNPLLWWASLPVTLWAIVSGASARDPRRLFSGLGFCALYLPWGLSPRTLNFSHYLFEAIPYACLSLGSLLDRAWDAPRGRLPARLYLGLVALLFLFFFPFLTAFPIPRGVFYWSPWRGTRAFWWFESWI
jgi:dolichyl-phosphate-mannose--protein O-mannosyl transferase